jgi:hypothetical protein
MAININAVRDVSSGEVLLSTTTGIDLATAPAEPTLYVVPGGQTVVVTKVIVRVTAASAVVGNARAGVGSDAAEGNMLPPRTLTGLSAVDDDYLIFTETKQVLATAGTSIKFGIDSAITSGTLTVAVDLFGYFLGGLTGIGVPSWTAFTPTSITWTSNVTFTGHYLVTDTASGAMMDLIVRATLTGDPGASELTVEMPPGYQIDTSRLGIYGINGNVGIRDISISNEIYSGAVVYINSTRIKPLYHLVAGSTTKLANITNAAPFAIGGGDIVDVVVRLPVTV